MLLTDNPIGYADDDRFGFRTHAEILCAAIAETADLPLTVGIFGPWGTGKSSFMQICRDLLRQRGIPTVSFNPWKYDRRDEIWHALIQTVLTEIETDLAENPGKRRAELVTRTREQALRLSRAAAWLLARRAVVPLTGGLVGSDDADALRAAWQNVDADQYRHVNHFERDFAEVVDRYTGHGRLVLLVDDLDRCTPEAAITVLDSLKLFLGAARCVFVLAMDQQVLTEAAAGRLGGDLDRGRQYLEKLIQFPYHLPEISFGTMRAALRGHLDDLGDDDAVWALIEVGFGRNPRRIRRFINAYNLAVRTLRRRGAPKRDELLHTATLLTLRLEQPEFFQRVRSDPGVWSRMDLAASGDRSALRADELDLVKRRPELLVLLAVCSPGGRYGFPPLPDATRIGLLTDVLAVTGGPTASDA
jgi:hypothetical protein